MSKIDMFLNRFTRQQLIIGGSALGVLIIIVILGFVIFDLPDIISPEKSPKVFDPYEVAIKEQGGFLLSLSGEIVEVDTDKYVITIKDEGGKIYSVEIPQRENVISKRTKGPNGFIWTSIDLADLKIGTKVVVNADENIYNKDAFKANNISLIQ